MSTKDTVIQIIATELGIDPGSIAESSSLVDELGADSPHLLEIALAIEEQFGVKVSDAELAKLHTVSDIVTHVQRNIDAAARYASSAASRSG